LQSHIEDVLMDIFSSLPFPAGTANIPKNVINKKIWLFFLFSTMNSLVGGFY